MGGLPIPAVVLVPGSAAGSASTFAPGVHRDRTVLTLWVLLFYALVLMARPAEQLTFSKLLDEALLAVCPECAHVGDLRPAIYVVNFQFACRTTLAAHTAQVCVREGPALLTSASCPFTFSFRCLWHAGRAEGIEPSTSGATIQRSEPTELYPP